MTVGTQLAFDRLVGAVDAWAAARGRSDVFAQIGEGGPPPKHIAWARFIDATEFATHCHAASVIVAHLGMGSIITALEYGKPIVVMPRLAALKEHRNDHQLSAAAHFESLGRVAVAYDAEQLCEKLDRLESLPAGERVEPIASPQLVAAVRGFIRKTDSGVGWSGSLSSAG